MAAINQSKRENHTHSVTHEPTPLAPPNPRWAPPRIECRAAQLMDGEDEQTWVFYSAKRGIMDARARAVPHGDERPIWATVHSGGSERIAHAVEHPRTSLPHNARLQPRRKERGRDRAKGID